MPIIVAVILLWVGAFLDMASTYFLAVLHGDQFREVNQFFTPGKADFIVINAVFLFVFSAAAILALIDFMRVKKYIRETGFGTFLKEMASKRYYRKESFVSFKVVLLVSILVVVGAVGGARFLAFVNNLVEYLGYSGFMRLFLSTFAVHDQLAVTIVFVVSVFAFFPITYILLRLSVR